METIGMVYFGVVIMIALGGIYGIIRGIIIWHGKGYDEYRKEIEPNPCTCSLGYNRCKSYVVYRDGLIERKGIHECGKAMDTSRRLQEALDEAMKEQKARRRQHEDLRRFAGSRTPSRHKYKSYDFSDCPSYGGYSGYSGGSSRRRSGSSRRSSGSTYDPVSHGYGIGYGSDSGGSSSSGSSDSGSSSSGGGCDGGGM